MQIVSSNIFTIKNSKMFKYKIIRKKRNVLFLKLRNLVFKLTLSTYLSLKILIIINSFLVASLLIIYCSIFVCSLLIKSQVISKKFSIFATWNCVFCLNIRNIYSQKLISISIRNCDLAIDCDNCVLASLPVTVLCEKLHCSSLKQLFDVPKYEHGSRWGAFEVGLDSWVNLHLFPYLHFLRLKSKQGLLLDQ